MHVRIEPLFVQRRIENLSGFSTSGVVRAIEARQLLRAAQVGGLPDARLEMNVYELVLSQGLGAGDWIGEAILLRESSQCLTSTLEGLRRRPSRRVFTRGRAAESSRFLAIECARFAELDRDGRPLFEQTLEFVVPRTLGRNTIAVAALRMIGGVVHIGIDDDDLPAAQCFNGNSDLLVAPAWRLPREIVSTGEARAWIVRRLGDEHGLACGGVFELGGRYHPSPGLTPEVVYPLAVEVLGETPAPYPLHWIPLSDAMANEDALLDGHLRIVAFRAAHAVRLLSR